MTSQSNHTISPTEIHRRGALSLVEQLVRDFESKAPNVGDEKGWEEFVCLGPFDSTAMRQLVGYLRDMGLVYHALPLVKLENVHVNRVVEMWLSDEAVGMTAEEIQAHVELYGEFPLPLADPDEQRRVQRDRKMRILGGVLEVKRVLRGVRQVLIDLAPAQGGTAGGDTGIPDSALMSPRALAEAWGIPGHQDAIEKAFDRADLPDSAKVANENRKPREPRFNYRVGSVRPILDKLRDTLSRERPAKK